MAKKKIENVVNEAEVVVTTEQKLEQVLSIIEQMQAQINAVDLHAFFASMAIANAKKASSPDITDETIAKARDLIEEFRKKSVVYGESKQQ